MTVVALQFTWHYIAMAINSTQRAPLLGTPEVSIELDVPEATLVKWRYQGTGPTYIKVGRHVRYRRADLDRWLDEQTHHATAS